jgi:uncharacterized protein YlxW (UPF0749 family)
MARIALGITVALLLITCFFGYSTSTKVQGFSEKMSSMTAQLNSAQGQANKAKADAKQAEADLAKAAADEDQIKSQLSTAQSGLADQQTKNSTLSAQVDDLTKKVAAAGSAPTPPPAPTGPSPADMDKLNAQLKDAQAQVAELAQLKDTLASKAKDAESRADDLQKLVDHYKSGTMRNGLEGEVLAVNPGWNFVVLSIGDRQGAVTNAEMILTRGGSQIGKVRITSVEPSTSVADIIPGSLGSGVTVQPGDRVIFPGG